MNVSNLKILRCGVRGVCQGSYRPICIRMSLSFRKLRLRTDCSSILQFLVYEESLEHQTENFSKITIPINDWILNTIKYWTSTTWSFKFKILVEWPLLKSFFCWQVLINGVWMVISPARAMHHYPTRDDNLLVCDSYIDASYMIAFSYPIVLIVVCTVYAVLTRKIPEAFNESKHIGKSVKFSLKKIRTSESICMSVFFAECLNFL